jgi:hypothetical protein
VVKSKRAKTELAEGLIILVKEMRARMVEALGGLQSRKVLIGIDIEKRGGQF